MSTTWSLFYALWKDWDMMFERFTDRARKVMTLANQEALRCNHQYIGTEHILLGLIKEGSGVGASVLKHLDLDLPKMRLEVEKLVKSGPEMVTMGRLPQTPRAKKVIEYAVEEARDLNHNYVGTEHLLLGLCCEAEGTAWKILTKLKVSSQVVREEVANLLGEERVPVNSDLLPQLQEIADRQPSQNVAPFSFRFIEHEARYELLDSTGEVIDAKAFTGPVGAYMFNALRKHEKSQQVLREAVEVLGCLSSRPSTREERLTSQIERLLDY